MVTTNCSDECIESTEHNRYLVVLFEFLFYITLPSYQIPLTVQK